MKKKLYILSQSMTFGFQRNFLVACVHQLLKESTTAQKYIFQIFPIIRNILRQTSNLFLNEEEALYLSQSMTFYL